MYTEKNLKDDLYYISSTYYVKYRLLEDYVFNRINWTTVKTQLSERKNNTEINEVLLQVNHILQKIQQNGGKLDTDPLIEINQLRKSGELQKAYDLILPYVQAHQKDEDAIICFGWVMYDYLKQTENNIDLYCEKLDLFNTNAQLNFYSHNEFMDTLNKSLFWSIRKVAQKSELFANKVFEPFIKLCGNNRNILEKRFILAKEEPDPARLLTQVLREKLNEANYVELMRLIGFDWFDHIDYRCSTFKDTQGEVIEIRPLAERILNSHAKKMIDRDTFFSESEVNDYITILEREISKNPNYEWLPYYKIKLLIKNNRKQEALNDLTEFARRRSGDFWVWGLLSDVVSGDEIFQCLCKGLLCRAKQDMLVGLQEKIIPYLLERNLHSNAKFELDACLKTRENKGWAVPATLKKWENENWYHHAMSVENRDELIKYAKEAEKIIYRTISFTDIFVKHVNMEKCIVNFVYLAESKTMTGLFKSSARSIKEGYFYTDSLEANVVWESNQAYKVKMMEDSKQHNLFRIYGVASGDKEFSLKFIQSGKGYVEKEDRNPFAFVKDDYIPAKLVQQHKLTDGDEIEYEKKKQFNKKKNKWGWTVEKVTSISNFEPF